jgi:6-phosphogluconolactonase
MTAVRTFDDLDALSRAAADDVIAIASAAVAERGACSIALSGGSTPRRLFDELARRGRAAAPWPTITLWWGDERTVPPDHADSNYGMARAHLIVPLGLDPARVHRMAGEHAEPATAASAYERTLVAELGSPPVFDLVLLGMGPDGHTASLFPGSRALAERERHVVANVVTSPLVGGTATRLTLTAPVLSAARHVRFLVAGADKAHTLAAVLHGPRGTYPAQLVEGPDVVWLVDRAAVTELEDPRT